MSSPPEAPDRRRPVLWTWRPAAWSAGFHVVDGRLSSGTTIAPGTVLFHDLETADVSASALSPDGGGLALAVNGFTGSYLSLSIDLPAEALAQMVPGRLFEAATAIVAEPRPTTYLRLCTNAGPNIRRHVRLLDLSQSPARAGFDLASETPAFALRHAWAEIIFEGRISGRITIPHLLFWIAPKAGI